MAYSTPTIQSTGDLITVTIWNQNVVYNVIALLPLGLEFFVDGGGAAFTTGLKGVIEVPCKCVIDRQTLLLDQPATVTFDIWKDTYADYPPDVADTITASAKPSTTAVIKDQDSILPGWTTAIAAGDIVAWNVDDNDVATWALSSLKCSRS